MLATSNKHNGVHSYSPANFTNFHPLLTGGIIPTSSPGLINNPSDVQSNFGSKSSSISTYSRFTVTAQLLRTFVVMPGYRDSSVGKSFVSGSGAGSSSDDRVVKVLAVAK